MLSKPVYLFSCRSEGGLIHSDGSAKCRVQQLEMQRNDIMLVLVLVLVLCLSECQVSANLTWS